MNLWLKSVGYHRDYERLGEKGSWNFIGPEFASAAASPSAFFKFYEVQVFQDLAKPGVYSINKFSQSYS